MRFLITPSVKKNAVALKRHVSAEFKEYRRSDSAYRLRSRLECPHQFSPFSSLAFVQNCNIFAPETDNASGTGAFCLAQ